MKKVSDNWQSAFPAGKVGPQFWAAFEENAKNASTEIFKVKTAAEAKEIVTNLAKFTNAKKVVAVNSAMQEAANINEELKALGIAVYNDKFDIAEHAESADIGISTVEFAIGESGSLCMDGFSYEARVVTMLPPIHIAFMNANNIVPGISEAFEVISKVYDDGYVSFITGPSRTADIERVLTIGVHGPSRLILIAVDEDINGGVK
ncbi:LutC/YkgG family protein [Dendrosporobacter sp. 1207_IL3150]|uniref:LutC/YkgG family protein n=1 Tax=Dendrosporobacter sp. 1207_IL3150 TaxID=3084054 RepID=UPI002FD93400